MNLRDSMEESIRSPISTAGGTIGGGSLILSGIERVAKDTGDPVGWVSIVFGLFSFAAGFFATDPGK